MNMHRAILLALLPLLAAAAPDARPSRDQLLAECATLGPATLAFERTATAGQSGGGDKAASARIDRWDGKTWTLLRVDGKAPSADEIAKHRKATSAAPVPGYYRLGKLLANAAVGTDGSGRMFLKVDRLPPGSVMASGTDIAEHFTGEATVAPGPRPYIAQVRLTARAPFRMMLVAKVDSFVTLSEYRLGTRGIPELVHLTTDINGSMMGSSGVQHTDVRFVHR